MLKKRRVDARLVEEARLASRKKRKDSIVCPECGVCQDCAASFYNQYGVIIRAVATQIRTYHQGEILDTETWISLMDKSSASPRQRTLYRPYMEDLAIILAAAKRHNHPVMFFEYAMKVINHPAFDLAKDSNKLLPWNLPDYYFEYVKESEALSGKWKRQDNLAL